MTNNYLDLVAKVDAKFSEIKTNHQADMTCHLGCHACCKPDLSVSRIEKESIRAALLNDGELLIAAKTLKAENPHGSARCSFLSRGGHCAIYAFRPLICRSHGAPIRFRQTDDLAKDVCPLNFRGMSIEDLPETQFINLELLNTILALINEQAFGANGRKRYRLDVDAILEQP